MSRSYRWLGVAVLAATVAPLAEAQRGGRIRVEPRMWFDGHLRMDSFRFHALERARERMEEARARQFARRDQMLRRGMEARERAAQRLRDGVLRLRDFQMRRPLAWRRYRPI